MRKVAALAVIVLMTATARMPVVDAAERVAGRVVAIRPPDTVLLLHDASGGMPAMTMPFHVTPAILRELQRGTAISAAVDSRSEPWTLTAVRVIDVRAVPVRYIPPLHEGDTFPDVILVDQRERPVTFSTFRGQALVLSFIYTRCSDPGMCPLVSAKFAHLQRLLAHERIHLLEVSLDPSYDTPTVLARYGAAFGADPRRWTLATGDPTAVSEIAARVGIVSSRTSRGIVHSEAVVIVDPAGRLAKIIDGNEWTAEQVSAEARAARGSVPDPVVRLGLWLSAGVAAACGGGKPGLSMGAALALFATLLVIAGLLIKRLFRPNESPRPF